MKLTLFTLMLAATSWAQVAVENQTEKAQKMGDGVYTSYVITYDRSTSSYSFAGCCSDWYQFTFSDYSAGHKKFEMKMTTSSFGPSMYIPDEDAYPVTFVKSRYMGDADMIEKYHAIEQYTEERIVFLDEWVYVLTNWINKDNYEIEKVFAFGEITGGKAVKEAFAAKKKMEKANHKETLQAYLDAAFAKQQELLPKWKEENQSLINEREEAKIKVRAEIDGVNSAYWNSEEGQRKLAEWRKEDVTLVNDTNSDLLLCYGSGAYKALKPGEKTTFSCNNGKVYRGTLRPNNNSQYDRTDNILLDLNGNNCGNSVNASSVIH